MQADRCWGIGRPTPRRDEGLHQIVARIAAHRPDTTALIAGDERLSYGELDATADRWAAELAALGVRPADRVPIVLPRTPQLVIALLAVLKVGGVYALTDPAWPAARLREIIERLDAPVVIADRPVDQSMAPVWAPPAGSSVGNAPPFRAVNVSADAPCCVFFTSGTTGRPKGVLSPHRATARLFTGDTFARFGPRTTIPLAAPTPWDAFSLELWAALCNGGTSVLVSEPYLSSDALRSSIAANGVDSVWLTSSLFNMLVDEDLDAFRGLSQLMIGGERLSPPHVQRFLRRLPGIVLINGYGPVESTIFATTRTITPADCQRRDGIPLGRPVPGTQVYVLDGERPCLVGEVGEICVAGDGLALGYLGEPALTARKFTTLRLDGEHVRVYRSGDLGYWDAAGLLHFRGRADRQVKIRGHRVEPAEIERRAEELLPVRSCRVVVHPQGNRLLAYCVPRRPGDRLPDAVTVMRTALPAYLVPDAVLAVDTFPLTPQGKLDERELLTTYTKSLADAGDDPSTKPANAVSTLVADVIADVLNRASVPPAVSFWHLGGSSLEAGRVCARLAGRLGRPVPLSRFFEHPTASALAGWLRETADTTAHTPVRDRTAPDDGPVPLTPMQLVYLSRYLADPADLTSHCVLTWVITGDLDRNALAAAIATVHRRHEPLRAAYRADPSPSAQLADVAPPPLEVLPDQPSIGAATSALRSLLSDELMLGEGDVWRTALAPAGSHKVFACVVHHIAFDGWSESVLAGDLSAAYNAAVQGADPAAARPDAPSLATMYRLVTEQVADSSLERHRDAQRARLSGVPAVRWPVSPVPAGPVGRTAIDLKLPAQIVGNVSERAAASGVSRFTVLLAEYAAAFADTTGHADFAVGVPVALRGDPTLEDALGCHIATVPVRLQGAAVSGGPVGEREVARVLAASYAARGVPLRDLLDVGQPPGGRRPRLFQTLFALQDNAAPELSLHGTDTRFVRQPYLDVPLDLHTELWPGPSGSMSLTVQFRADTVGEPTADELAKRYAERLAEVRVRRA